MVFMGYHSYESTGHHCLSLANGTIGHIHSSAFVKIKINIVNPRFFVYLPFLRNQLSPVGDMSKDVL